MVRTASVQQAMYGNEPTPPKNQVFMDKHEYNLFLSRSFDWYNNSIKDLDKKKWVVNWGIENGYKSEEIKRIPESYLSTIGSMVRIKSNGFKFTSKHETHIEQTVSSLVNRFNSQKKKKVVRRNEIDNVSLVMTDFDQAIDAIFNNQDISIKVNYPLTPKNIIELKEYYTSQLGYLSDEPDNKFFQKHKEILKSLESPIKKPVQRKPRKKKVIPKSKQVSKLNYMKVDKSLSVKSFNPEKIIGATKLVVFNTNNRKLTIYHAESNDIGFTVKGSTLLGFDEKTSGSKTIRKPEMKLSEFVKAPKVRTNKIYDSIKAVSGKVTGRINKHCVLIKVF